MTCAAVFKEKCEVHSTMNQHFHDGEQRYWKSIIRLTNYEIFSSYNVSC